MSVPRGVTACLLALFLLLPASAAVSAESIPHEQFDEAEFDLMALKLLLDHSLSLATQSIMSCVYEDPDSAVAYSISLVDSLEAPAAIAEELSDEIDVYEYLVTFIPPFETMASDDSELTQTFTAFMQNLTTLRLMAQDVVLPPETYDQAMDLLARANAYVQGLRFQLDGLEGDALAIGELPEIPEQGYLNVTPLLDAIQALRDKLAAIELEIELLAENVLNPTPRLFLVANSDELYLGQTLMLTGYLFYLGAFIPDMDVTIERDGELFRTADTGVSGRFSESYVIPIDEAELGPHAFAAWTVYGNVTYYSQDVPVNISRIPTRISLDVLPSYELGAVVDLNGSLEDYEGLALEDQDVSAVLDGISYSMTTDMNGSFAITLATSDLVFGLHSVSASYGGNGTHGPSSTPLLEFMLKYPAVITLQASEDEIDLGGTIVLFGTFSNTSDEPIGNATVRIVLNGVLYASLPTLPNGTFSLSIDTDDIGQGTHSAFAEHDDPPSPWSYTRSDEVVFTVNEDDDSGFIPGIVTNPDDLFEEIKDLLEDWFLGEHWFLAWAILIMIAALLYMAYRKLKTRSAKRRVQEAQLKKALLLEPSIVTPKVRPLASLPAESRKLMKAKLWQMIDALLGSMSPRDAIVHGYGRFLQFLDAERSTHVEDSLTHREIQDELVFMGYPKDTVRTVTGVYEKAMFTERDVTVEDALGFADSLAILEGYGRAVPE